MASPIFQSHLRAALDRQVYEHEQSAARFVETVASLCEAEEMDGRCVAGALRALINELPRNGASRAQNRGAPERLQVADQDYSSNSPPRNGRSSARTSLASAESEWPSPAEKTLNGNDRGSLSSATEELMQYDQGKGRNSQASHDSGGMLQINKIDNDHAGHNLRDMTQKDQKYISSQFQIHLCSFITDEGKIKKPPTELMKALGPRYAACMKRWRKQTQSAPKKKKDLSYLEHFIESSAFKAASVMAITLNYLFIIAQTDRKMSDLNSAEPLHYRAIDLTFTCYYTFEVGVTMVALRSQFFFGFDSSWNLFDLFIVSSSIFEEVLTLFNISAIDTSFLRVMRFLRISKILRMFEAMRMLKEVKIMVDSLMGSFFIFMCCCLMLALYLSVFSIFFVQALTTKLEGEDLNDPDSFVNADLKTSISQDWSSVLNAMVALFMALTGGEDWGVYLATVEQVGVVYQLLFFFFYLFAILAFFNVVTGVFCEKAMSLARPGAQELMVRRQAKEVKDATELIGLMKKILKFEEAAPPLNGEMFDELLTHPEVITYFEVRGMNPSTCHRFFQTLVDIDQKDEIPFRTFVSACVKLDGPASSIDSHVLSVELKAVQLSLHNLHSQNMIRFDKIMAEIGMPREQAQASRYGESPDNIQLEMIPMLGVEGLGGDHDSPSADHSMSLAPLADHHFQWDAPLLQTQQTPQPRSAPSSRPPDSAAAPQSTPMRDEQGTTYTYHQV